MVTEQEQLQAGIAALESQRALLGDAVAEAALAPLRAKLAALAVVQPPATQTLKQVTILFLDVVGSTTLSQHLDPEEIHAVIDGALARFTTIVESHRGRVLQYAGDSLLAVFGAEDVHEDDPERAVRCGLGLLAEGLALGEEIKRAHHHNGFNVRVGMHTGGVLLGGGVDAEGSIRGIAVNIAARMEQTAPAGGLRISIDTYRHVRGVFDVEPQVPIVVKGVDEPIATYLVLRAKPRAFRVATRGIEGVETRMIGRDAELEMLQDAFRRLLSERQLSAVTVVGEAGMGKSRLLYEFENWAEARPEGFYLFRGRANPQTQSQPYGLLRDILAWRLQIADSDSMECAKQKVEQGIAPLFTVDDGVDMAQGHAHLLGHLIGLDFAESPHVKGIRDDGRQIRNRGFHVAAQMFRRVGAKDDTPIVLLIDDLHWADDGSLDFLNYLAQVNRDVSMLVLGLARPTLFERRSDRSSTDGIHRRIDLLPLDKGVSRLLANELLKKLPEIPAALRELISSSAEGNPFYMEELVKMFVDEGAIETSEDRWTVIPDKLLTTHVPQTLTGVLQARLDGLKAAEKLALQQASVIGFVFWDEALAAIDIHATEALPAVTRRELVVLRQDTSLDGVREYAFKHQILHHVTYDTVLKRMRRDYHAKVAAWLAGLSGARANDFLGVTAEHYDRAGDHDRACEYFTRAAEHAKERFAHEATLGHVARALALIGEADHPDNALQRWRLVDVRERTLHLQGKRTLQQADIDTLQRLADALDDDRRRGEVAWRRSNFAMSTSDYLTTESAGRQTVALAERAGDVELGLRGLRIVATALCALGERAAAKALAQRGLAAARSLRFRKLESAFLSTHLFFLDAEDDLMAPLEVSQQILLIEHEIGDRRGEAGANVNLGASWLELGELVQARRHLEEGWRLLRAVGDRASEPYPLSCLSDLARWQGDDTLALVHAQSALDIAIAVQDRNIEREALDSLGNAELALGRYVAAKAAFERAHAVALSIDAVEWYKAAAGLARVALAQGDMAGALQALEGPLARLFAGGTLEGCDDRHAIHFVCYQALTRAGDPRAAEVLASAHAQLQARALTITDATLRRCFLTNVPEHREIVAAWAAQKAAGSVQD